MTSAASAKKSKPNQRQGRQREDGGKTLSLGELTWLVVERRDARYFRARLEVLAVAHTEQSQDLKKSVAIELRLDLPGDRATDDAGVHDGAQRWRSTACRLAPFIQSFTATLSTFPVRSEFDERVPEIRA
jgi:hypothetical protein